MASKNVDIPARGNNASAIVGSPPKSESSSGFGKLISGLSINSKNSMSSFGSRRSKPKDSVNPIFREDRADNNVLLRNPDEVRLTNKNSCDMRSGRVLHLARIVDDQYDDRVKYMRSYLDKIKSDVGEEWEKKAKVTIASKFPQMKKVMSGGQLASTEPMPSTAGSWGLIDVNILPEGEVGNVITTSKNKSRSVSTEISPGFMGARLGAIKTDYGKSEGEAIKVYKDRLSKFRMQGVSCEMSPSLLSNTKNLASMSDDALAKLWEINSPNYLERTENLDIVLITVEKESSKEKPTWDSIVDQHVFEWQYSSTAIDAPTMALERIATFKRIPLWIVIAETERKDFVRTLVSKTKTDNDGVDTDFSCVTVYHDNGEKWAKLERLEITENSIVGQDKDFFEQALATAGKWKEALYGSTEYNRLTKQYRNSKDVLVCNLPTMLSLCYASMQDTKSWCIEQRNDIETSQMSDGYNGFRVGRIMSLRRDKTHRAASMQGYGRVIAEYNKRGGRNHYLDVWL